MKSKLADAINASYVRISRNSDNTKLYQVIQKS